MSDQKRVRCSQCNFLELKENVEKVYVQSLLEPDIPYDLLFCRGSCERVFFVEHPHLRLATQEEVMSTPTPSYDNVNSYNLDLRYRQLFSRREFY